MGLCVSAEPAGYDFISPYDGETSSCFKCRHGKGTYQYSNGDTYEGEWKWDKKHGPGVYKHKNGEMVRGELHIYREQQTKSGSQVALSFFSFSNGRATLGTRKRGYFYEDEYIGQDHGNLFAATSCFTGCFGSNSDKPLESDEGKRKQEQRDRQEEQLQQNEQKRKERKEQRNAMAKKYGLRKNTRSIQEPKK